MRVGSESFSARIRKRSLRLKLQPFENVAHEVRGGGGAPSVTADENMAALTARLPEQLDGAIDLFQVDRFDCLQDIILVKLWKTCRHAGSASSTVFL